MKLPCESEPNFTCSGPFQPACPSRLHCTVWSERTQSRAADNRAEAPDMAENAADGAQSDTPRSQGPAQSCHYRPQSTRSHGTTLTQRQVATWQCTSMLLPRGGGGRQQHQQIKGTPTCAAGRARTATHSSATSKVKQRLAEQAECRVPGRHSVLAKV
jgi:hypothetical protein